MTDSDQILVAEIQKNANERWRIGTSVFNGYDMVFCRAFYDAGNGDWRPTKNGFNARREQLADIVAALQKIDSGRP